MSISDELVPVVPCVLLRHKDVWFAVDVDDDDNIYWCWAPETPYAVVVKELSEAGYQIISELIE